MEEQITKICSKCKLEKPTEEFSKKTATKDGLQNQCKGCVHQYHQKYYEDNRDKINNKSKQYYNENNDRIVAVRKIYRQNNKQFIYEINNKYRLNNANTIKHQSHQYYIDNREKITAYAIDYQYRKYNNDDKFKLQKLLRNRLNQAINKNNKSGSAVDDLGCSIEELKQYLESKFQEGMNWSNHSKDGWHIDHILPLASFDLSDPAQFKIACHYTNLQPLWAKDNLSKGDKVFNPKTEYNDSTYIEEEP